MHGNLTMHRVGAILSGALAALLLLSAGTAGAGSFRISEVPSATAVAPADVPPGTIVLGDHREDKIADAGTGLIRFEDWARERPERKRALSPFPAYAEPTVQVSVHGIVRPYVEKLHVYDAEARFVLARAPGTIDLSRFARLDVLETLDPSIKHRLIDAERARPNTEAASAHNRHPERRWCEAPRSLCIESRYPLEGKLPLGIRLANKLEEGGKKISEFMEFQSELRVLAPGEVDQAVLARLTALGTPVAGVLEQTIFDVNQVMQFAKLMLVLQEHPKDPARTVATVFMVLAVETDVLERKKEFEKVPVLRNLIPAQVLMGRSSFNTGASISAGLPEYTRNRIAALAEMLGR